jgi:large subunit ribosomal protein L9
MKVILTANIKKLGKVGDLVNVKDGFARNYLFPQNIALRENKKNIEYFEKLRGEIAAKEKIARENAKNILKKLDNIKIVFQKEADEKNQLYGSVSAKEIHSFLLEKDIKINIDDIQINEPIKSIGEHTISISPYDDLSKHLNIFVDKTKEI